MLMEHPTPCYSAINPCQLRFTRQAPIGRVMTRRTIQPTTTIVIALLAGARFAGNYLANTFGHAIFHRVWFLDAARLGDSFFFRRRFCAKYQHLRNVADDVAKRLVVDKYLAD